jgi:dUTP pyrophosphatase
MEKSYYLTGWKLVSPTIPLQYKNYEIYKDFTYNADVILGIIDAVGVLDITNINLTIPYNNEDFLKMITVPYKMKDDNIIISKVNYIDLMGKLYRESTEHLYDDSNFNKIIDCNQPVINFIKINKAAIIPTKANFSDVGYDISILNVHKKLNSKTTLYDTGICLNIPVGYYVEIVPRSSIVKSGYMLSNSIGIIDCSYKGNLYVGLTKVCDDAIDIEYPFKCCQLIVRKQVFPKFIEMGMEEVLESKRNAGGFGSTNV